jgi:ABC-type transport system involved in Fe-S cluster assembly fused permease/ATPase subunit
MSQLSFNHLLNLSFSFHTRRKTGEILRVLDRGAAINHTLEVSLFPALKVPTLMHIFQLILFNILPTFIDIAIALVVFAVVFEWTLTLVIFVVMLAYGTSNFHFAWIITDPRFAVSASIVLTQWRTRIRRQMNERDVVCVVLRKFGSTS